MEGSQKWRHRQTSKYVFGFVVSTSQSDMADRDVRKTEKAQKNEKFNITNTYQNYVTAYKILCTI